MADKGNYYKYRTKKWFLDQGWACELCEKMRRIVIIDKATGRERVLFSKKDLFGADGISMNGEEIVFWNSKLNKSNVAAGIKEMLKYPFPKSVERWIIVWQVRAKNPTIVNVGDAVEENV
jgi:hypothetical protein